MAELLNTLTFVHKMLADVIKLAAVHNRFMRHAGCNTSIIDFYNGSCVEDVKFMFW